MPTTYPLFDTRTMLAALEQMYPARTFLKDTFFKRTTVVETEYVDYDVYKGKRRVATYVSSYQEGNVMSRIGFQTLQYKPPYIKEKIATNAEQFLKRTYGETIYQAESPLQRAQRQVALDMADLDDAITRAEELQCSQALFTGSVTLLDGNTLTFAQSASHQITNLLYLWSDTVNSKPLSDVQSWRRLLNKDSGVAPNVLVFGSNAINAFLNHPQISGNSAAFSQIKVERGSIDPKLLANGVIYWGYISEIGCDIYSYDEWYIPSNNPAATDAIPMVPTNSVLMGSTNARMDAIYGPILDMEALVAVRRFPKSWIEPDPSVRWMMMQSSPLMVPTQVDSYLFATVC